MRADLDYITRDREAFLFSLGCIRTGIVQRIKDFDTRFTAALWLITLFTVIFALYHIQCAWRGMTIILGRHDPVYQALLNGSASDQLLAAKYHIAIPFVVSLVFGLGIAHLAAAYFLFQRQLSHFFFTFLAGLIIAITAVSIQLSIIWNLNGIPSEFMALTFQSLVIPALLLWSNGRHVSSRQLKNSGRNR